MRIEREVNINLIDIDRIPLSNRTLQYANCMERGDMFPPIHLQSLVNGRFRLLDGRHRFVANKLLDKIKILSRFSTKIRKEKQNV